MLELDCKESWVLKKWWFWTVVLEKTLESPLGSRETQSVHRKGDQSWCSLEGLMFKLKLQYFGHLMWRADPFEKTLMLGKMEGRQRRGLQWMRWLDGITASMDISFVSSRSWWWTARPGVLKSMESQRVGHNWVTNLNLASFQVFFHHLYDFFGEMTIKSACFFNEVFFCLFFVFFLFVCLFVFSLCVCVCVCVCVFCFVLILGYIAACIFWKIMPW